MTSAALCAIALIGHLLPGCGPPETAVVGYVEGDYVAIAPIDIARIAGESVRRGDVVKAGAPVATLETTDAEIAVDKAQSALAQATADLANLQYGRRPEEIASIQATLNAAKVQADDAKRTLDRRRDLFNRGVSSQSDLDTAQTAFDVAYSRVGELVANLAVAKLPARPEEIASSEAKVAQGQAAFDQAKWRLDQRRLVAPADGYVSDIIRRVGEVAGPSAPVVSFLPDGALKLSIFVPEAERSRFRLGQALAVHCDGCEAGLSAIVDYIAREPEFTPPVIYSLRDRQTLVYLVEARPGRDVHLRLQPGEIVDVDLPDARQ